VGPLPTRRRGTAPSHSLFASATRRPSPESPWFLILQAPSGAVSRVEIDGELRLGRNPECELLLDDPQASRLHARLRPTPEGVLLTDEGSTNGTRVNGKKVSGSALLRDGDNIAIGGTKLRVVAAL
jgi:pSer/pThr/pTyr-binding forkhead associated (FHA) protein